MLIQPYLNFNGRAEEAIEFYKTALGAEVAMMMRFRDNPEPPKPGMGDPGTENKIMHASLRIGDQMLFASDGRCHGTSGFQGITLSITVKSDAEAETVFAALGNGGTVCMPLAKTFFSSSWGMVNDRFGVPWMVLVNPNP